jgi:hypothetical protein
MISPKTESASLRCNEMMPFYASRSVSSVTNAAKLFDAPRANWSENYNGPDLATVDHVIPLSWGGTNHPSNLVVACSPCNMKKGHS